MRQELVLVEDHPLVGRALVRLLSPHYLVTWALDPLVARGVVGRAHVIVCAAHFGDETRALLNATAHARRIVYGEHARTFAALGDFVTEEPERLVELLGPGLARERRG